MTDTYTRSPDGEEKSHRHAAQAERQPTHDTNIQSEAPALYSPILLGDARMAERANAPVRADVIQSAQQTHGNRAIQRFLNGTASAPQEVQRTRLDVGPEGGPLPDGLARRIEALRGAGAPLNGQARARMESAFGESLDDVRIHAGEDADALNQSVGARAFTTGSDIFLRNGVEPTTDSRLLAHELTHVLQQRGSHDSPLSVGPSNDTHEQEAHEASDAIAAGDRVQVRTASSSSIARDIFDGVGIGDWKILPPTYKGETDGTYDDAESKRRAEMQAEDERGKSATPNEWWKDKPKYDPKAPPPWMPKVRIKEPPGEINIPPKGPDERGDYPLPPWPEGEGYA